jgi:hypothetical protein
MDKMCETDLIDWGVKTYLLYLVCCYSDRVVENTIVYQRYTGFWPPEIRYPLGLKR